MTLTRTQDLDPRGKKPTRQPFWAGPTFWLALIVATIGVSVLFGYLFEIVPLRRVLPGAVEMKANTAVALVLAAVSLCLLAKGRSRTTSSIAQILGATVALIGAITLLEYLIGVDGGIDSIVLHDTGDDAYTAIRGRMSPYSTIAFLTIGIVLALPRRAVLRPLMWLGTITTGLIGSTSLLGYAWNAQELTTDQWMPPVAIHTALGFVLLSIAASIACGLISPRVAPEDRGRVETKVLVGFLGALCMLFLGGGITYRMYGEFADSAKLLSRNEWTRTELGSLYASIADAETSQGNYLLTGKVQYIHEENRLAEQAARQLNELQPLLEDDPDKIATFTLLRDVIDRHLQALAAHVEVFERQGLASARHAIDTDGSAVNIASIRRLISKLDAVEAALLETRESQFARDRGRTLIALLLTLMVATVTLVALFGSIVGDIRERMRIARALDDAEKAAQRATRAKSEFLASMSHEIRTPMNGVIGMLELLQQSSLVGAQLEMVKLTRESADALLTVIDDILDFSKIEAGRLEIERQPFSIADVIEKTCSLMNRLAERKEVILEVFCDPRIPQVLLGDATRLRQVLINLVGNAIKFSSGLAHPGRVSVHAELCERSPSEATLEVRVADNGIGIESATLERLFSSFTQADASTTRRYGGTGLGLAISKQLVELMQGSIHVDSLPDQGSTFRARVPLAIVTEAAPHEGDAQSIAAVPCLLVEEAAGAADALAAYLSADGADLHRAIDQDEIERWMRGRPPGCAVLVVKVPDQLPNLETLMRSTRVRPDLSVGVVLVVTARSQRNPVVQGDGLLIVDGNALSRRTVANAVARAAGRGNPEGRQAIASVRRSRTAPPSRAEAIRQGKLLLVAEDNEINQRVIIEQLNLLGYAADVAPNGRKALERWRTGEYALLFADLHMPEMDGYALTLQIRLAEAGAAHLPIIALTANALKGEAQRCHSVGMDGYLTKPATLAVLAATLERWLNAAKVEAMEVSAAVVGSFLPHAEDTSDQTLDLRVLEALVGDDADVIQEFVQEFKTSAAQLAEQLVLACHWVQPLSAAAIAHKLKSSARMMGALKLGDICEAIEVAGHAGDARLLATLIEAFNFELTIVQQALGASLDGEGRASRRA